MRVSLLTLLGFAASMSAQSLDYPKTRKVEHVDDYNGTKIADPYRWLEDDKSEETAKWVEAQNRVTFGYLNQIPYRAALRTRLEALMHYPRYSMPHHKGPYFFFTKNDGLQNQAVVYVQKGLDAKPEVLIDPNTFSADGTTRLTHFSPSKDGSLIVFGKSTGGSDWSTLHVMETATRRVLSDELKWVKVSGAAWAGRGFYYSRYPEPAAGHELSSKNENHKVYYHRVGMPQSADELVFEDPSHPLRFHHVSTTDDERLALLTYDDRVNSRRGNALFVRDLSKPGAAFVPVVREVSDSSFDVIDNTGDRLLIFTNDHSPRARIVEWDPTRPGEFRDIVPESNDTLQSVHVAGGKLFLCYSRDVTTRVYVYSRAGKLENEIALPTAGTASVADGQPDDPFVFFEFTSFTYPATTFRYDLASQKSTVFHAPEVKNFRSEDYETKQVFFTSKDGTKIPMFLVYRKGLKLDGNNPTLLYGYGGFQISIEPAFDAQRLALIEQGFVYASANLRGGGEYGEAWHEAGIKNRKQNVFDDFIAAAEWLIANKYTSPRKLAVNGGSNGGLLVGAVINQRPELFRAAVPQVGVMDMLRYHKFTIGWNWAADYGVSDNPAEFKALRAYSPLHNVRAGGRYPATLITTADHDDRVVPAHSFKYAATMQELAGRDNTILIRVDTKSGHGASSTTKAIETRADVYAFLMHTLGVTPKLP